MPRSKKRSSRARKPAPKCQRTPEEDKLLECAMESMNATQSFLEHEVAPELRSILRDELSAGAAAHERVIALLKEAPADFDGVPKPKEAYGDVIARAVKKVDKATDLIADVYEDPALREWFDYVGALIQDRQ